MTSGATSRPEIPHRKIPAQRHSLFKITHRRKAATPKIFRGVENVIIANMGEFKPPRLLAFAHPAQ